MKRRTSANPKVLTKAKNTLAYRRRQRELDKIRERGFAAIGAFWLRIGVKA